MAVRLQYRIVNGKDSLSKMCVCTCSSTYGMMPITQSLWKPLVLSVFCSNLLIGSPSPPWLRSFHHSIYSQLPEPRFVLLAYLLLLDITRGFCKAALPELRINVVKVTQDRIKVYAPRRHGEDGSQDAVTGKKTHHRAIKCRSDQPMLKH